MFKNILLVVALMMSLNACHNKHHKVSINDVTFNVEVANDNNTRAMGLMYRKKLSDNSAMLFIFPDSQPRAFWMENTLIPLDIIYFDQKRRLINISENTPPCKNTTTRCPNYPSDAPAKYVLEINAGLSKKHGFKKGDVLNINLKK